MKRFIYALFIILITCINLMANPKEDEFRRRLRSLDELEIVYVDVIVKDQIANVFMTSFLWDNIPKSEHDRHLKQLFAIWEDVLEPTSGRYGVNIRNSDLQIVAQKLKMAPDIQKDPKNNEAQKSPLAKTNIKGNAMDGFRGFEWGDNFNHVKANEESALLGQSESEIQSSLRYEDRLFNLPCQVEYLFHADSLILGIYLIQTEGMSGDEAISNYSILRKGLCEKYGEADSTMEICDNAWRSDKGAALLYGLLKYSSAWNLKDTYILLTLKGGNYNVGLFMVYAPLSYKNWSDSTVQTQSLDKL